MFKKGSAWKKGTKIVLWIILVACSIFIAERKLISQRCENIVVKIDNDEGVNFVTKSEVESLISKGGSEPVLGSKLDLIDLSEIEKSVLSNKLVKNCQAVRDLGNNLVITVNQQKPVARWISQSEEGELKQAMGFYISDDGKYLPLSNRYSAHVLLVSGDFFRTVKSLDTPKTNSYLELIKYIRENEFWNAQVNQLIVDRDGEVSLIPTLGNQVIEFGLPENIDFKFKKLKVFYKTILSADWNRYSKVNVKYKDQIVCE